MNATPGGRCPPNWDVRAVAPTVPRSPLLAPRSPPTAQPRANVQVLVGDIPDQQPGFLPRPALMAQLALDLLRQPAGGRGGAGLHHLHPAPARQAGQPPGRLSRRRPARPWPPPRSSCWPPGAGTEYGWGSWADHRAGPARGGGRGRVRRGRAAGGRADPAAARVQEPELLGHDGADLPRPAWPCSAR